MVVFFFVPHSGVGVWKFLVVKINSQKKLKTPHGFPVFFRSHWGVGFWKVLDVKINSQKKLKRHMVFHLFVLYPLLVKASGRFGLRVFFFWVTSHSAVGFWKVLAVKINSQKKVKTWKSIHNKELKSYSSLRYGSLPTWSLPNSSLSN